MKEFFLKVTLLLGIFISNQVSGQLQAGERNYEFGDGVISRTTLESYLSRAITQGEFCLPSGEALFEENVRMLKNIGAKFIGRAAFEWTPNMDAEAHFAKVAQYAAMAHEADSTWILQACVFEAIYKSTNNQSFPYGVDLIPVPDWVFEEFGLSPETRNFNYEDMLYPSGDHSTQWENGGGVPDITQLETQMYFYYRAVRYIDAGYEAIHWGQVMLMGQSDSPSYSTWFSLLERVRGYAKDHARHGMVLCDAHAGNGIKSADGHLLLDFHGYPQRPREICDTPYACELVLGRGILGQSVGGITPSGWECTSLPYLVEFDNSGADDVHDCTHPTWYWPWGWDEITWFAHCTEDYRNEYLRYAFDWLAENDPAGHLEMPGCVTIAADPIPIVNGSFIWKYTLNNHSPFAPQGFGQEDVVKELWDINKLNVHQGEDMKALSLSSIFSIRFEEGNIRIKKLDGTILDYLYSEVDFFDFTLESDLMENNPGDTTLILSRDMNGIIKVYPNPVSHGLNIDCSELGLEKVCLEMYDLGGRQVDSEIFYGASVNTMDVSGLEDGVYLLRIRNDQGNRVFKIIKN